MDTIIFWGVVLGGIGLSRVLWPNAWKRKPGWRLPAPAPFLKEGLPPGSTKAQRRKGLADTKVGDYIAIVGRVGDRAELVAPLSRRPCVASDMVLFDAQTGDRVARVLRAGTFLLDTGTETALVDARGAFVRVTYDHRMDERDRAKLDESVIPGEVHAQRLMGDEGIIGPGEYVLVIGVVERPTASDEAGYRNLADSRIRIAGGGVRPSVVSTVPADLHTFGR